MKKMSLILALTFILSSFADLESLTAAGKRSGSGRRQMRGSFVEQVEVM